MIAEPELLQLLASTESFRIEKTVSTTDTDKFREALKVLGFVNRFGRGVERAQAALQKNGSPPATFEFGDTFFGATLHANGLSRSR